jgi:ParB family chromosome partitioning protein
MLTIQEIPLSKLVPSKANVRRTSAKSGVEELAASIEAHGLLQNLTVRPSAKKGGFEVVAGGRRLAALKVLAKKKVLAASAPIPCQVVEKGSAEEISLAENVTQCPMHPADQFEAFAKLHDGQGMSAEDIAARFGVTSAVVRQRLRLGAISPKLMKAYRDGDLNLDQLTAFAITDDHAAQERVWSELPKWCRTRQGILEAMSAGQVHSTDRRARFVGADAYEAAGGVIARDLFDAEGGGFFTDPALLNRLVEEKLQEEAATLSAEGWKWVEAAPEFDYQHTASMRRLYPERKSLTDEEQERLDALGEQYDALAEEDDSSPERDAELARLESEIEALSGGEQFAPEQLAMAGAFVALSHDGSLRIERGFVRPEDAKAAAKAARNGEDTEAGQPADGMKPLSERLVAELTSHRTAALRNELAQSPGTALIAVVHALAAAAFFPFDHEATCLEIKGQSAGLEAHAAGIGETRAAREIAARHEGWKKRMPETADGLWAFIQGLEGAECLDLLAHCASLSLNAIRVPGLRPRAGVEAHAATLAQALSVDMTTYWQPTVDAYLGRVSKDRILEAVREGVSASAADNLGKMKKQAMAQAAAQRLEGKNWLPAILR